MTKQETAVLKRLRHLLTMRPECYSDSFTKVKVVAGGREVGVFEDAPMRADEFVRNVTAPWRESWILPALDALLDETRGHRRRAALKLYER